MHCVLYELQISVRTVFKPFQLIAHFQCYVYVCLVVSAAATAATQLGHLFCLYVHSVTLFLSTLSTNTFPPIADIDISPYCCCCLAATPFFFSPS